MSRRYLLIFASLGLVMITGALVYLAVRSSSDLSQPSAGLSPGSFQPITTQPAGEGPREGARAPDFSAPKFGGGTLNLAELRGRGVMINFFASWCAPCRAEAHDLEAMYQEYRSRGVTFLGVDIQQDDWDDASDFLAKFGITYPAVRDIDGQIARKYQLVGLPTTYFIDKNGIVRAKYIGAFLGPEGPKELERRIQMILP